MENYYGMSGDEYWFYTFTNEAIDSEIEVSYAELELFKLTFKTI